MRNQKNPEDIRKKLHNHTEDIVIETMEEILEDKQFEDICTCEQCLLDIASYTLNRLPAKYIASYKGDVLTKVSEFHQQVQVDLISIITQAIQVISKEPHHD